MNDNKKLLAIKLSVFFLLSALLLAIHFINPLFYNKIWSLSTSGNIQETIDFLQSFGLWAMAVSLFIDILINALGFLPSIFISTANGVLFGIIPGIIISWLAETIGVVISFFLMRSILRGMAETIVQSSPYLKKIDDYSGKNGFKMMLFARTLPYFPSGIITALGALSSISVWDYVWANLIGKFPSTALEVIIGHDVVNYEKNLNRLTVLIIAITAIYGGLWYYQNKRKKTPWEDQNSE